MKNRSLNNHMINGIYNIASVQIDTELPIATRIEQYVKEVGNPYLCCVGDTVVEIVFSDKNTPIQDRINNLIDSSMNN